jgi:hypothetical protein
VEAWIVPISVALIGGPVMYFLRRFDRRNTDQHAENKAVLDLVLTGQERIESKVDGHIAWHLESAEPREDDVHAR